MWYYDTVMKNAKSTTKDTRFKKGNPGRKQGRRNKAATALESLLGGQAQKAVSVALQNDMTAGKLCLDRICPPRKSRPVQIELPKIETAVDAAQAHAVVIAVVAA
jgi:hypothetical protein